MVNKITLLGYVGKSPEITSFSNGRVANFSLAVTEKWTKDGEKQEKTNWFNCQVFGKLVDVVEAYVDKGQQLFVEGKANIDTYEKDGQKRTALKVVVRELVLLGGKNASDRPSTGVPVVENARPPMESEDDSLPF